MKDNAASKGIPVLFYSLSGDNNHGSLLEIHCLTKPVGITAMTEMLASKGFFGTDGEQAARGSILIVDDEPGMLELHARIVKTQLSGYRVLLARDGRQALEIIHREPVALVLLDLMMPVMYGFAVLEEMRKYRIDSQRPGCGDHRAVANEGGYVRPELGSSERTGERHVWC